MWRIEREGKRERRGPVAQRLPRRAIDEVEVERLEAGVPCGLNRRGHVRGVVRAPERGEHVRHHRLHAEAQSVHSSAAIRAQQREVDRVGVALDCHLSATRERDVLEHAHQRVGRHERRRAAAEEHARGLGHPVADRAVDVGGARVEIRIDEVHPVRPGRERAVVTSLRAERDVHVHAESRRVGRHQGRGRRRPRSSRRRVAWSASTSRMQAIARTSSARTVSTRPLKSCRCTWIIER